MSCDNGVNAAGKKMISSLLKASVAALIAHAVCTQYGISQSRYVWVVLLCAYLPSYLDGSEHTGERYWDWFCKHPVWRWLMKGKCSIEYEERLDKAKQYMIGSHPHGVMSYHHMMYMCDGAKFHEEGIPGSRRRDVGAPVIFKIPIYREMCLWLGAVSSQKQNCRRVLREGLTLISIVGGMDEQIRCHRGEHIIYVNKRKGFIKLAIEAGVPIVPAYCFGENNQHHTSKALFGLRRAILKYLQFAVCLFVPLRFSPEPLSIVMGKPIPVPPVAGDGKPTQAQIDDTHAKYVTALQGIFERHKAKHGVGTDVELKVL